jgi:hypothetical protein
MSSFGDGDFRTEIQESLKREAEHNTELTEREFVVGLMEAVVYFIDHNAPFIGFKSETQ